MSNVHICSCMHQHFRAETRVSADRRVRQWSEVNVRSSIQGYWEMDTWGQSLKIQRHVKKKNTLGQKHKLGDTVSQMLTMDPDASWWQNQKKKKCDEISNQTWREYIYQMNHKFSQPSSVTIVMTCTSLREYILYIEKCHMATNLFSQIINK